MVRSHCPPQMQSFQKKKEGKERREGNSATICQGRVRSGEVGLQVALFHIISTNAINTFR